MVERQLPARGGGASEGGAKVTKSAHRGGGRRRGEGNGAELTRSPWSNPTLHLPGEAVKRAGQAPPPHPHHPVPAGCPARTAALPLSAPHGVSANMGPTQLLNYKRLTEQRENMLWVQLGHDCTAETRRLRSTSTNHSRQAIPYSSTYPTP